MRRDAAQNARIHEHVLREPIPHREMLLQEMHLPVYVDARAFNPNFSKELLENEATWTADIGLFLRRHLFSSKEGLLFRELWSVAEDEYSQSNPDSFFPVEDFRSFINFAFQWGLIELSYQPPNGDINSRERFIFHRLTAQGKELVEAQTKNRYVDNTHIASELLDTDMKQILRFLAEKQGDFGKEELLDMLTRSASDSELDEIYDRYAFLIDQSVIRGLLEAYEDPLGAVCLRLTEEGLQEHSKTQVA